ncbi:hypothetical protein CDAR_70751 [Caerostris darwini]|uniref:Uncharacterized protein n=1 Tax=Caerostris darwini TaxID=1538125 RepID=A0AAV4WDK0_9ARAC|nr:hypothetical protein CDAR_70751 [Caerostris darwini]
MGVCDCGVFEILPRGNRSDRPITLSEGCHYYPECRQHEQWAAFEMRPRKAIQRDVSFESLRFHHPSSCLSKDRCCFVNISIYLATSRGQ